MPCSQHNNAQLSQNDLPSSVLPDTRENMMLGRQQALLESRVIRQGTMLDVIILSVAKVAGVALITCLFLLAFR